MIAEAPSGRIVLANDRLEEILRIPASEIHHIAGGEAYQGFDADGRELLPEDWPLARAVKGETVPYTEIELRPRRRDADVGREARRPVSSIAKAASSPASRRSSTSRKPAGPARTASSSPTRRSSSASSLDYEETIRPRRRARRPADRRLVRGRHPRRDRASRGGSRSPTPTRTRSRSPSEIQDRYPPDPDSPRGLAVRPADRPVGHDVRHPGRS